MKQTVEIKLSVISIVIINGAFESGLNDTSNGKFIPQLE